MRAIPPAVPFNRLSEIEGKDRLFELSRGFIYSSMKIYQMY